MVRDHVWHEQGTSTPELGMVAGGDPRSNTRHVELTLSDDGATARARPFESRCMLWYQRRGHGQDVAKVCGAGASHGAQLVLWVPLGVGLDLLRQRRWHAVGPVHGPMCCAPDSPPLATPLTKGACFSKDASVGKNALAGYIRRGKLEGGGHRSLQRGCTQHIDTCAVCSTTTTYPAAAAAATPCTCAIHGDITVSSGRKAPPASVPRLNGDGFPNERLAAARPLR